MHVRFILDGTIVNEYGVTRILDTLYTEENIGDAANDLEYNVENANGIIVEDILGYYGPNATS